MSRITKFLLFTKKYQAIESVLLLTELIWILFVFVCFKKQNYYLKKKNYILKNNLLKRLTRKQFFAQSVSRLWMENKKVGNVFIEMLKCSLLYFWGFFLFEWLYAALMKLMISTNGFQGLISPTFYAHLFHTKVLHQTFLCLQWR